MRRALYAIALLAFVAIAGCEDTPTDPTNQAIVGEWKASRSGAAFPSLSNDLELHFESGGDLQGTLSGETITGTYTTTGVSSSSTIRQITMNITAPMVMNLTGIYEITGNQMKLEVVPAGSTTITAPDATIGIGSAKENGSSVGNKYVAELQKQ